jgi:large subunit ribosomal protein L5
MQARLHELYNKTVIPEVMKKNSLANMYQVPRLEKIVLNVGAGEAKDNPNFLKGVVDELTLISGQKPVVTKAKKAIAAFKIRKNLQIGAMVTLRGARMYDFLDRFLNFALPRVKDFKGVSPKSFDRFGNYSLGLKEQIIFPEIVYDKVQKVHGMDIVFVMRNGSAELSRQVLETLGMPFRKK